MLAYLRIPAGTALVISNQHMSHPTRENVQCESTTQAKRTHPAKQALERDKSSSPECDKAVKS